LLSFPGNFDYSQAHRSKILCLCGLAAVLIAVADFAFFRDFSVGFLYIIPLAVAAGFLSRWQVILLSCVFAVLRETGVPNVMVDDFAANSLHVVTTAAAFAMIGLLVKELAVNQQFMRERARHLEERRELEDQLRHAQRLEAIGRLAGGVAHDFNNLLSVIIGYSDFALARTRDDELRRDVEQIRKSADRAALLTRQLLVFSRRQKVEPRLLDLNELVSNLDKMLRRLIGEDIDLQLDLHSDLPKVRADAGQMDQVLMNLALNARDAMPGGGRLLIETGDIDVSEAGPLVPPEIASGRYVRIIVSDTGIGMDEHIQEHIFEPFFTTKEAGKGTGLGLSMVYGLVRQNNGYVWFRSTPGEGTSFAIYLPVPGESIGEEPVLAQPSHRPAKAGSGSILVVEDYAPVRSLAAEILKKRGYSVVAVSDAAQALAALRRREAPFDLLLTDVVMPGMSGSELAQEFVIESPRTRVLFMTGYSNEENLKPHQLPLNTTIVQKPFTADSLLHAVQLSMGKKRPTGSGRMAL
jgi:two-component system, cell cycle sensor histidine kinase and response regulator CckA